VNRRLRYSLVLLAALGLVMGACASEDSSGGSTTTAGAGKGTKVCQVTDTGGVDDKSFNQTANEGVVRAQKDLGVEAKVLESKSEADYEPNIQTFVDQNCDLIIPVGFLLDKATQASAKANPKQKYSIVDVDFFDTESDPPKDISYPNVEELTFATDQAAFLAGYTAASVSKSGKVGTYGGIQIPTVTIFMDGFLAGVQQYNKDTGKNVEVLGWNGKEGLFTGDFQDQDKGKSTTKSLIDEGADVILPVAGPVGQGTIAQVKEANNPDLSIIWVDVDGCKSLPDDCKYFLTTVEKKMDNAVYDSIKSVVDDNFTAGVVKGTLANKGVDIAEFNDWDSKVTDEVKTKLDEYRQKIIDGTQSVTPAGS
jgi:basic membrane protein A and related proteins